MAELKLLTDSEPRNPMGDWVVRGGVAVFFVIFGMEKFSSDPGSHWVKLFEQIGAGVWFRYFTGVVEVLGGLLVLIPRTALAGLALGLPNSRLEVHSRGRIPFLAEGFADRRYLP